MMALSLGLWTMSPGADDGPVSLMVTGLTMGTANTGDVLSAVLSNGAPIQSYAWGSAPEETDYGAAPTITVPAAAASGLLFVTVQSAIGTFSTVIGIGSSVFLNVIESGLAKIGVVTLAPPPAQPTLVPSAGIEQITVEIS